MVYLSRSLYRKLSEVIFNEPPVQTRRQTSTDETAKKTHAVSCVFIFVAKAGGKEGWTA